MEMLFHTPDEERRYFDSGIWGNLTIVERFRMRAAESPGKLAIVDAKSRYTYGQLARLVDNLATNFLTMGLGKGEVVAVQVPNWTELPIIHFALNRIGALCMPIHHAWRDTEVAHLLKQGRAVAAVVPLNYRGFDYPSMLAGMRTALPDFRQILSIGGIGPHSTAFEPLLNDVAVDAAALDARRPHPNEPGALMLSSGTTGLPKLSVFSSNNMYALVHPVVRAIRFVPGDIAAVLASAGTGAIGYCFPILTPLLHGGSSVVLERWDPAAGVALIRRHRCTYGVAVPAQLTQMLPLLENHSPADFEGFRAFFNAGAPLPYEVGRRIEERMNCRVICNYGATDGGTVASTDLDDPQEKRLGTVGRPSDGREVKLVDAYGNAVGPGEPGEIYWRTADKSYGYLNDDEATRTAFTPDRFYRSGDLGRFDEEGYLKIIGRVKDMILRGGRNISPRLIEEAMAAHPAILDVAVAAMPDPVLGERACAFAVLRKGCTLSFEEAIAFLKERKVSVWQLPERLEIMEELPKSAVGKILKNQLTQFVTGRLNQEANRAA